VEISDGSVIKCSYELCGKVVNKSNIHSKTPSKVTHTTGQHISVYSVDLRPQFTRDLEVAIFNKQRRKRET
jgi:hypothetical protein